MKKLFILILILTVGQLSFVNAAKPIFMIKYSESHDIKDPAVSAAMMLLENLLEKEIKRNLPCAEVYIYNDIQISIGFNRMQQLAGLDVVLDLAGSLGANYLVIINANRMNRLIELSANCYYLKKGEAIATGLKTGSVDELQPLANAVKKEFIKELMDSELCPYSGPLTIEVKSDREESETYQIGAPCDVDKAIVTATTKAIYTLKWELNKYSFRAADGNVKYDLFEKYTTVTNFPCYKCRNGDQGPAVVTETNETEAKAEGLSNESVSEGKKVSDARIKIVFLDDGTYTLLVEATSKRGPKKDSEEKKIEGMCENESEPKITKNKQIDVPINVVLGPYKGTTQDKVLHQKETKDLSQGKEKTTVTIDFTLTRSEN